MPIASRVCTVNLLVRLARPGASLALPGRFVPSIIPPVTAFVNCWFQP